MDTLFPMSPPLRWPVFNLLLLQLQEVTKLVYEVTDDDVTRAKNQLKAMQLFGIGNTGGEHGLPLS